jgi:hypothetical protein
VPELSSNGKIKGKEAVSSKKRKRNPKEGNETAG